MFDEEACGLRASKTNCLARYYVRAVRTAVAFMIGHGQFTGDTWREEIIIVVCSLSGKILYQVCCSVLQCVAVCCSVLQCVALCCTALQCAVYGFHLAGGNSDCCVLLVGHNSILDVCVCVTEREGGRERVCVYIYISGNTWREEFSCITVRCIVS